MSATRLQISEAAEGIKAEQIRAARAEALRTRRRVVEVLEEQLGFPQEKFLAALAATVSDERRGQRFLALTGIETDELRRRANEPAFLASLIAFLEAHEPDLVAVCEEVGVKPEALVEARRQIEGAT